MPGGAYFEFDCDPLSIGLGIGAQLREGWVRQQHWTAVRVESQRVPLSGIAYHSPPESRVAGARERAYRAGHGKVPELQAS